MKEVNNNNKRFVKKDQNVRGLDRAVQSVAIGFVLFRCAVFSGLYTTTGNTGFSTSPESIMSIQSSAKIRSYEK